MKSRVFVGLSGGVDSSVAAALLKKQGYEVIGVFMRCFNVDGCAEKDVADARRVAGKLGIPFYVWDFEENYKTKVVEYMVKSYRSGITPNPDVMCNKEIKFGLFLKKALAMGADYVATGHYARLSREFPIPNLQFTNKSKIQNSKTENLKLKIAKDPNKDQSYFLWTLTQGQLRHCLFPIGDYLKSEVRKMAARFDLPTATKKDSQGICFLGKVTISDFLKQYIPKRRGAVMTTTGKKIGEHEGAQFYTIGQRRIGVSNNQPIYVVAKDIKTNILLVAEGDNDPKLYKKEIRLLNVNFIGGKSIKSETPALARVRYRQPLTPVKIINQESKIRLIFDKPQKFVASGQSAVCYTKRGELLGGGIIA